MNFTYFQTVLVYEILRQIGYFEIKIHSKKLE